MEELFVKWRTMWDAKEYTTQLFFLANLIIAGYITWSPFRTAGSDITALNRGIIVAFGIFYEILTVFAYFQLVPTFSPYE